MRPPAPDRELLGPMSPAELEALMEDLAAEVRAKRESGDLPAELESQLDLVFARFVPAGVGDEDFEQILDTAAAASFMDAAVPVASRVPGGSLIKWGVRKLVGWYVRYLAQQLTTLADILVRALRSLGARHEALAARVVDLERAAPADSPTPGSPGVAVLADPQAWAGPLIEALAGSSGRVCHAECGPGVLVQALRETGIDAYGVEPDEALAISVAEAGRDVRPGGALAHLRSVPEGALGGIVLSGCVDRVPAGVKRELAALAGAKVGPGAVVAVVSAHPRSWDRSLPPIQADLAPGRPFHPQTWSAVLEEAGLTVEVVLEGDPASPFEALPGDAEIARVMNSNLEVLRQALFGPASYLVVARRRPPA